MSLPITGQAQGLFQQISQKSGTPQAFSSGWHNEMLVSELLPRYAAAVLRRQCFFCLADCSSCADRGRHYDDRYRTVQPSRIE